MGRFISLDTYFLARNAVLVTEADAGTPVLLVENQVRSLAHRSAVFPEGVLLVRSSLSAGKKDCVGEGELDISFPRRNLAKPVWRQSRWSWAIGFAGGATVHMVCRII
jgi:hypothetical protein